MWSVIWLGVAVLVAWVAWEVCHAPEVDEGNCPVPLLLEHGRCPGPCRLPPPCTEDQEA